MPVLLPSRAVEFTPADEGVKATHRRLLTDACWRLLSDACLYVGDYSLQQMPADGTTEFTRFS